MNNRITIIFGLIAVLVLSSCMTRRLVREAEDLEKKGDYVSAAELYHQALSRRSSNDDARSGFRRTGTIVLQEKLSNFNRAYNDQRNREAVYNYLDAKDFYNKAKSVNVNLNFPSIYHEYYNEVKNLYLEDRYFEAYNHLQNESFSQAETIFREIIRLQPNYRDAREQLNIAIYEPVYRESLNLMDNREYRAAYFRLKEITNNLGTYKDSHELKRECIEKGSYTIAVAPIINNSSRRGIERNIESQIINKLNLINNPFLRLVDKTVVSQDEVESTMVAVAPDAILFSEINSFDYTPGRLEETEKRGYLKRVVEYKDDETDEIRRRTEYSKVTYSEFEQQRSVSMNFSYRLVDDRTGRILNSGTRTFRARDRIHYAVYGGDSDNLVPGYWKHRRRDSEEDVIRDSRRHVRDLQALLDSRKEIKSYETLVADIFESASEYVSSNINRYIIEN